MYFNFYVHLFVSFCTVPQKESLQDPILSSTSEQGVSSQQEAPPPSQQPLQTHTPLPQMSQTPLQTYPTLLPMNHTQAPSSSLQPVTTPSAPQNQTQQPQGQQTQPSESHTSPPPLTPPSTSQPQQAAALQGLVSGLQYHIALNFRGA